MKLRSSSTSLTSSQTGLITCPLNSPSCLLSCSARSLVTCFSHGVRGRIGISIYLLGGRRTNPSIWEGKSFHTTVMLYSLIISSYGINHHIHLSILCSRFSIIQNVSVREVQFPNQSTGRGLGAWIMRWIGEVIFHLWGVGASAKGGYGICTDLSKNMRRVSGRRR